MCDSGYMAEGIFEGLKPDDEFSLTEQHNFLVMGTILQDEIVIPKRFVYDVELRMPDLLRIPKEEGKKPSLEDQDVLVVAGLLERQLVPLVAKDPTIKSKLDGIREARNAARNRLKKSKQDMKITAADKLVDKLATFREIEAKKGKGPLFPQPRRQPQRPLAAARR